MATLTGLFRIGRDAEVRALNDGTAVLSLALAYNYGKKEGGKQPSQWVDAAMFGTRAEKLAQYLTKGATIVATLSDVHVREYKKKDGTPGSSLSGKILDLEFAGSPASAAPKPAPTPKPAAAPATGFADDDLDGIPF